MWTNFASSGIQPKIDGTDSITASRSMRRTAFADDDTILLADVVHSTDEERFYLLGLSARLRLLLVIHWYRADDGVIRLISARKATSSQRAQYAARWKR